MKRSAHHLLSIVGVLLLIAVRTPALAQDPIPIGKEFQVNNYTTGRQYSPAVAIAPSGGFMVVWQSLGSPGSDSDSHSIQAQRFDGSGAPQGGQLQVNAYTTGDQILPQVDVDDSGNFIVVWQSKGSPGTDTDGRSIQGQVLGPSGRRLSDQFQINAYTTGDQQGASITVQPRGRFVVVWAGKGEGGAERSGIQGRRFQLDGSPLENEFQVNSYTLGYQLYARTASDRAGNFVVTWTSSAPSPANNPPYTIQARRFLADATPRGDDFQINTSTNVEQMPSHVGVSADGAFVVTWVSISQETGAWRIQGQRLDRHGSRIGQSFQPSNFTTADQFASRVAVWPKGEFFVTWQSFGPTPPLDQFGIVGREYNEDGAALSDESQVNNIVAHIQTRPAVATDPDGRFVVAWLSWRQGGMVDMRSSIQARMFLSSWVFQDSFESGDTSCWSSADP